MKVSMLFKYINLCKEFNKEPSWDGLKYFKMALK